jgi:small conductance mechanosensitive channel
VLFLVLASASKSLTRRFAVKRRTHQGATLLICRLVQTSIVVLGFLIAFSVVAPSFQAADLIKMLGIGSVAIGECGRYSSPRHGRHDKGRPASRNSERRSLY